MPLMSPIFRERNHARIIKLHNSGCSPRTIASAINDGTGSAEKYTATDVRGYLKISVPAADRMLISKKRMEALLDAPVEAEDLGGLATE